MPRPSSARLLLLLLAGLLGGATLLGGRALLARSQGSVQAARLPQGVPLRWAIALDADRPFYLVGDTLKARCTLANLTQQDAAAWSPVIGGNGCHYRFELQNGGGDVVWEPGSIVGGVFSGPGCLFAARAQDLPAGTTRELAASIPLVYQNGGGHGTPGQALPSGFYQLVARVTFIGPTRPPATFGPGLTYEARLPLQIE